MVTAVTNFASETAQNIPESKKGTVIKMKKPKTGDFIIFAVVLLAAIISAVTVFTGAGKEAGFVTVQYDGGKESYPLSGDREVDISSGEYHLTVAIENREVFVKSSDCPDKICKSNRISKNGEVIICAPARVIISLSGEAENDALAG